MCDLGVIEINPIIDIVIDEIGCSNMWFFYKKVICLIISHKVEYINA